MLIASHFQNQQQIKFSESCCKCLRQSLTVIHDPVQIYLEKVVSRSRTRDQESHTSSFDSLGSPKSDYK